MISAVSAYHKLYRLSSILSFMKCKTVHLSVCDTNFVCTQSKKSLNFRNFGFYNVCWPCLLLTDHSDINIVFVAAIDKIVNTVAIRATYILVTTELFQMRTHQFVSFGQSRSSAIMHWQR